MWMNSWLTNNADIYPNKSGDVHSHSSYTYWWYPDKVARKFLSWRKLKFFPFSCYYTWMYYRVLVTIWRSITKPLLWKRAYWWVFFQIEKKPNPPTQLQPVIQCHHPIWLCSLTNFSLTHLFGFVSLLHQHMKQLKLKIVTLYKHGSLSTM